MQNIDILAWWRRAADGGRPQVHEGLTMAACLRGGPTGRGAWGADCNRNQGSTMTSVKQLIEAANAVVPRITPVDAQSMIASGQAIIVDVRDAPEVEKSGKVAGAIHVSRGMLEFRADPEAPYHDKHFHRDRPVILYCASGGRSALSAKVLKDLGYEQVYNLGAFKDWVENGGDIDKPIEPGM